MDKIICIGSVCKDIFFPTSEGIIMETPEDLMSKEKICFEMGAKYKIEERSESLGGCAANVAAGLSRLGIEAHCYAIVGGDSVGLWIKEKLKSENIKSELILEMKELPSDLSAIVINKNNGERIIFSNQKANSFLKVEENVLKNFPWLFIGDLQGDWDGNLGKIVEGAKKFGTKVAFNPRQSNIHDDPQKIIEAMKFAEVVFLNKDESIEIISFSDKSIEKEKLDDESFLLEKLKEMGPKVIVITDGVRGAWGKKEDEIFFVPGRKVNAVDSTGAGDSFCSGFLAAYIKEKEIKECMQWGISNSSHEVQFYGSIDGLLKEGEIEKNIK